MSKTTLYTDTFQYDDGDLNVEGAANWELNKTTDGSANTVYTVVTESETKLLRLSNTTPARRNIQVKTYSEADQWAEIEMVEGNMTALDIGVGLRYQEPATNENCYRAVLANNGTEARVATLIGGTNSNRVTETITAPSPPFVIGGEVINEEGGYRVNCLINGEVVATWLDTSSTFSGGSWGLSSFGASGNVRLNNFAAGVFGTAATIDDITDPVRSGATITLNVTGFEPDTLSVGAIELGALTEGDPGEYTITIPALADDIPYPPFGAETTFIAVEGETTANIVAGFLPTTGWNFVTLGDDINTTINGIAYEWESGPEEGDQIVFNASTITVNDRAEITTDFEGEQTLYVRSLSDGRLYSFTVTTGEAEEPVDETGDIEVDFTFIVNERQVTFTSGVDYGGDLELSYLWNFGDGSTSIEENPVHIYSKSNNYNVTLTVTDGENSDSITKVVRVAAVRPPLLPVFKGRIEAKVVLQNATEDTETTWLGRNNSGYYAVAVTGNFGAATTVKIERGFRDKQGVMQITDTPDGLVINEDVGFIPVYLTKGTYLRFNIENSDGDTDLTVFLSR
jgi:hypothetical protein